MSLNKAIESGDEYRHPYRKSKAVDSTCRNHGSCSWCKRNREFKNLRRRVTSDELLHEWRRADDD